MIRLVYGHNSVYSAIKSKIPISKLYVTTPQQWNKFEIPLEHVTKHQLDKITKFANHQGVVAEIIEEYRYYDLATIIKDKPSKVLVLDHIQDPQNLGAIIRSANAFDFVHIVIPTDRSARVTPAVCKVASGGVNKVKIILVKSLYEVIKVLKENHNYWIYASNVSPKAKDLREVYFNDPLVMIIGNEKSGVSSTLMKMAHEQVYISMCGEVESLNVSVATGIFLFYLQNIAKR